MAIEMIKDISLIDDAYIKYQDNSKKINNLLVLDLKTYLNHYSKKYVVENPSIYGDKDEKNAIMSHAINKTEKEVQIYLEEFQEKLNKTVQDLQKIMCENYSEHSMEEIRLEKELCLKKLIHLNDDNIKEIIKISDNNINKAADELKNLTLSNDFGYDARRNIDINIEKITENVNFRIIENKKNYIDLSYNYGKDVIVETANNLLNAKEKEEDTKSMEFEEKKSQEFNINPGDENRYSDFGNISENNIQIEKESENKEIQLKDIFSIYNVNVKLENGRIVGFDSNNEELNISYDNSNPGVNVIKLTDSLGNNYTYTETSFGCSIDAKYVNKSNEDIYPVYTEFRKNGASFKVSLSNGYDMYIYLDSQKVTIYDDYFTSKEYEINKEYNNVKEIVDEFKEKTISKQVR